MARGWTSLERTCPTPDHFLHRRSPQSPARRPPSHRPARPKLGAAMAHPRQVRSFSIDSPLPGGGLCFACDPRPEVSILPTPTRLRPRLDQRGGGA